MDTRQFHAIFCPSCITNLLIDKRLYHISHFYVLPIFFSFIYSFRCFSAHLHEIHDFQPPGTAGMLLHGSLAFSKVLVSPAKWPFKPTFSCAQDVLGSNKQTQRCSSTDAEHRCFISYPQLTPSGKGTIKAGVNTLENHGSPLRGWSDPICDCFWSMYPFVMNSLLRSWSPRPLQKEEEAEAFPSQPSPAPQKNHHQVSQRCDSGASIKDWLRNWLCIQHEYFWQGEESSSKNQWNHPTLYSFYSLYLPSILRLQALQVGAKSDLVHQEFARTNGDQGSCLRCKDFKCPGYGLSYQ